MKIMINLGREILLLGSVLESVMTPSETSSEKTQLIYRYWDCHVDITCQSSSKVMNAQEN
jgi:hypothetical protein